MELRNVYAREGGVIPLGRVGENKATCVIIDAEWLAEYPGAALALMNKRSLDNTAYLVQPDTWTLREGKIEWIITASETAYFGDGKVEILASVGDSIVKDIIYYTHVLMAINIGPEPPSPMKEWWQDFVRIEQDAKAAVEDAQEYARQAQDAAGRISGDVEAALAVIRTRVDALESCQTAAQGEIDALNAGIAAADARIAQAEADVLALDAGLADALNRIGTERVRVDALSVRLQGAETTIQAMRADVTANQSRIATMGQEIVTVKNSVSALRIMLAAVETSVGEARAELTQHELAIRELRGDMADIKTRMDAAEDSIGAVSDLATDNKSSVVNAVNEIYSKLTAVFGIIAPEFSPRTNYMAGAYVINDGTLYLFRQDHVPGPWIGSDVEETTLAAELIKAL